MLDTSTDTRFEDAFSEEVWSSTYKDHKDKTIDDTMRRVAKYVASAEKNKDLRKEWEENFYSILTGFKVTSGGRIFSNAGTDWKGTTLMNCISGDTLVLTSNGNIKAKDIKLNSIIEVLTKDGEFSPVYWKCHGEQELSKITFSNGETVYATEDHEWVVTKNKGGTHKVKTRELLNEHVPLNGIENYEYTSDIDYQDGIRNGLVFGDGYVYTDFSHEKKYSALQQFGDSRHLVLDYFVWLKVTKYKDDIEGIHYVNGMEEELKYIPSLDKSNDYLRGFIAGVIAADGCIDKRGCVVLHTANHDYAVKIKEIAVSVGIPVISLKLEREISPFDNNKGSKLWKITFVKKYFQKDKRLVIKNLHIKNINESAKSNNLTTIKCISVEKTNKIEKVYCCNEQTTHTFTIGEFGILTGNCFVSPRADYDIDSIEGILTDVLNQCQTLKSEGGWGQNFSFIRPRGAFIHGIGVETPGAVKYMEIYDKTSDVITSGSGSKSKNKKAKGKIRKGAMMSVLDVWHPDIVEFITAKQSSGRLSKFNISVNCTDEFMDKVVNVLELKKQGAMEALIEVADKWELRFPETTYSEYKEEWDGDMKKWEAKGYPTKTYKTISALWLWNLIMESTYNRAEPGVLFLDRANYFGPLNYLETIFATNPCGEQMLAPGGVCNLGSINLTQFINKEHTGFDLDKIRDTTRILNRMLDNINTISHAPLPQYEDSMKHKRRIGIGILGWGSALFMLKVRFGSDKADELRDQVMSTIASEAYMASIDLAEEKGMFKYCNPEKHAEGTFVKSLNLPLDYMTKMKKVGIRNSSLLSIQPTGNTSIFANVVSGGLEPIFMPEYIRTVIVNTMPEEIADVCPKWYEGEWHETDMFKVAKEGDEEILKGEHDGITYKIDINRGLTKEVLCEDYGVRWLKKRDEWNPDAEWAVTTTNLDVKDHVRDLQGFAKWVDSAMSKTVNVPNEYPFEDFKEIYLDSFKSGYVKGVTTYRAGTMTTVLSAAEEKDATDYDEEIILDDVKVPSQAPAMISTIRAEGKKWYLTTILDEGQNRPIAFFVHTNNHEKGVTTHGAVDELMALAREKGIPEKWIEGTMSKIEKDNNSTKIARVISLNLRHGVLIKNVVAAIEKVDNVFVGTFLFQIKKFLMSYIRDGEKVDNGNCPECKSDNFVYSEGCIKCGNCGYSKCG